MSSKPHDLRPAHAYPLAIRGRGLIRAFYVWACLIWILGIIVRLTVRDQSPSTLLTAFHYATPTTVLFLLAFLLAATSLLLRAPRQFCSWCLLGMIVAQSAGSHPLGVINPTAQQAGPERTALLWNVCHGRMGWDQVISELKTYDADVYTLIEAGKPTEEMREMWKRGFPEHDVTFLGGEMVLITRGKTGDIEFGELGTRGQYRLVELNDAGSEYKVMLVDIHGRPNYCRRPSLDRLAELLDENQSMPLLIAGDFNTPRESPLFQPVAERAHNAYDAAGIGFQPTWPWPLPLLTLDQVWGNAGIRFSSCETGWSSASDHRPVLVRYQCVNPEP